MNIEIEHAELKALVARMRADPVRWSSEWESPERQALREALTTNGVSLENLDEVGVDEEGFLSFKGEQVVLYIKDLGQHPKYVPPEDLKRFHIYDCRTLDRMRHAGRFERYVVTTRTDGKFRVDARDWKSRRTEPMDAKLLACKNCLVESNYKGYGCADEAMGKSIWQGFSLAEFLETHRTHFSSLPRYTDRDAPSSDYAENWNQFSRKFRASKDWICEGCHVNLSAPSHRRLLHVHHVNGVRGDDRPSNLRALCVGCHVLEPNHGRMRGGFDRELNTLRAIKDVERRDA